MADTDKSNGAVTVQSQEAVIERNEKRLAELNAETRQYEAAIEQLATAGITSGPAFNMVKGDLDKATQARDSLAASLQRDRQTLKTAALVEPLIKAFGTFKPNNADNLKGSLALVDRGSRLATLKTRMAALQDEIAFVERVDRAVVTAKISDDVIADFRPVHPDVKDDGRVGIRLAAAGRSGSKASGRDPKRVTAQTAHADMIDLVGKVIGRGGDYPSFMRLMEQTVKANDPEKWTALTVTSKGTPRSVSMTDEATKYFGLTLEDVETDDQSEETETDETEEGAENVA